MYSYVLYYYIEKSGFNAVSAYLLFFFLTWVLYFLNVYWFDSMWWCSTRYWCNYIPKDH